MSHNIFGKTDSTNVSSDELFLLWCMHTNTQVYSTYFVFRSIWRVVQARKAIISMGHIVTGLAYYFTSFDVIQRDFEPMIPEFFDEEYLMKAEIITHWRELEDVTFRRCYMLRQTATKHGDVPLPRAEVDEFEDVSEAQSRKREHDEEWSEGIKGKIKELIDISDNRIGSMIEDLSKGMEGFERRCESRAERLQAQIEELKQQIFQGKRVKKPSEAASEFIFPFTSPPSASK